MLRTDPDVGPKPRDVGDVVDVDDEAAVDHDVDDDVDHDDDNDDDVLL